MRGYAEAGAWSGIALMHLAGMFPMSKDPTFDVPITKHVLVVDSEYFPLRVPRCVEGVE